MDKVNYSNIQSKIQMVTRCSEMLKSIQETEEKFRLMDQKAMEMGMKVLQNSVNRLKEYIDAKIDYILKEYALNSTALIKTQIMQMQ